MYQIRVTFEIAAVLSEIHSFPFLYECLTNEAHLPTCNLHDQFPMWSIVR